MSETLHMKPYARLLTMLGEQLIKNEKIALIELVKNSYDADASWVKISFMGFGENYEMGKKSCIVIEDDGLGMSESILRKHWVSPATPVKLNAKKDGSISKKGRIIQGEKGIGRFSVLKLGKNVTIETKSVGEKSGHEFSFDFSKYNDDFTTENGVEKLIYLDDLKFGLKQGKFKALPTSVKLGTRNIKTEGHGTRITISDLKGFWDHQKISEVYKDLAKLESIFLSRQKKSKGSTQDFEVFIYKDSKLENFSDDYYEKFNFLLDDRAAFKIENGCFDDSKLEYRFNLNGKPQKLSLNDPAIKGLSIFKKYFGVNPTSLQHRKLESGSFNFEFYIFDFRPEAPSKFKLDKNDKQIIKDHRIYLYRDNIRVYPYGEPEDDWLKIDIYRGTVSAGAFLSNDQVVGQIKITQKSNPNLKDKTNREGLIESGYATTDFITLIQIFLAYFRKSYFSKYLMNEKDKTVRDKVKNKELSKTFSKLKSAVKGNSAVLKIVEATEKQYEIERDYLIQRAENTEELAGVGLSVEAASHDLMSVMSKVTMTIDSIVRDIYSGRSINKSELEKELQSVRGMVSFIESQLKDIQLLFKSSKQRRKNIRVKDVLEKVERIYRNLLSKEKIKLSVVEKGSPLVVKTTDAVLLQVFLNLFDNAIYWTNVIDSKDKLIKVTLDGSNAKLIFSDSGPGILKDDKAYVFEPFFSGKGEEGRGLGMYIARQLLERSDYSIELAELKSDKVLSGANFVISFVSEE